MKQQSIDQKQPQYFLWCLFGIVAILEFFFFKDYVMREVVPFYPINFDQGAILPHVYGVYENIKNYGFFAGISQSPPLPTGAFFPVQAALVFLIFGPSRLSALLLNLAYFVLLQLSALLVIRRLTPKIYLPLIFLGLMLSIKSPYLDYGSMMDFRMDFIGVCIYGIFICSVIRSQFFLDRKWVIITALCACLMISLRCITLVYLAFIMMFYFAYLVGSFYCAAVAGTKRQEAKDRIGNILIMGCIILVVMFPYLWVNKEILYNYYVVGHITGSEKYIRLHEVGITDMASLLRFYPHSLMKNHLGAIVGKISVLLLIFYAVGYVMKRFWVKNNHQTVINQNHVSWKQGFIFLTLSLLVPLLILTLDVNKSSVVGGIAIMPTLWLIMWTCLYFDAQGFFAVRARWLPHIVAVAILIMGLTNQFDLLKKHRDENRLNDLTALTQMYRDIGDYSVAQGWSHVRLSIDQICDYLTCGNLSVLYYEHTGKLLRVGVEKLGGKIFSVTQEEALASLKNSHVVILNLNDYPKEYPYPFNDSIETIKPLIRKQVEQDFTRLGDYRYRDMMFRVYVKPEIKPETM